MISTSELYGIDPKTFIGMEYQAALEFKMKLLIDKRNIVGDELGELFKHKLNYDSWRAKDAEMYEILKAIQFSQTLLEELE